MEPAHSDATRPGPGLTRDDIVWAYRLLLDREPESEGIIQFHLSVYPSVVELREALLSSPEFTQKNPGPRHSELEGGYPVPSGELIYLVAASTDRYWYLEGGRRAAETISTTLRKAGVELNSLKSVLDFGCGCGRVIRHLAPAGIPDLRGTDYNPRLIDWCRENLPFARFGVNSLNPPLDYADGSFDLVFLFSVMTHLTEDVQHAWMKEFARIIRPSGYLLFSTMGESYLGELAPEHQRQFRERGIAVRESQVEGTNTCGAFHSVDYVAKSLAARHGFEAMAFIPEGARGNPHQDVHLLRRKTS